MVQGRFPYNVSIVETRESLGMLVGGDSLCFGLEDKGPLLCDDILATSCHIVPWGMSLSQRL